MVIGRTDLEDGLTKLDTLTNEEVVMACARLLEVTHNMDKKFTRVIDDVGRVDKTMQVVSGEVRVAKDAVKVIMMRYI